jgi:hypothetical protein
VLPSGLEMVRRLHLGGGQDVLEQLMLLYDADVQTGRGPDPRLETIEQRWVSVGREKLRWERLE